MPHFVYTPGHQNINTPARLELHASDEMQAKLFWHDLIKHAIQLHQQGVPGITETDVDAMIAGKPSKAPIEATGKVVSAKQDVLVFHRDNNLLANFIAGQSPAFKPKIHTLAADSNLLLEWGGPEAVHTAGVHAFNAFGVHGDLTKINEPMCSISLGNRSFSGYEHVLTVPRTRGPEAGGQVFELRPLSIA